MKHAHPRLGQFLATAICGNDIFSSVLYVSGIAALFAGVFAPLVLLAVALVLFFYRTVYREVVETLPINGGAYNALLNATSKIIAALAGVMAILSYMATAVISARTAIAYLFRLLEQGRPMLPFDLPANMLTSWHTPAVVGLFLFFAFLVSLGVKDSAKVAGGIFVLHLISLLVLMTLGVVTVFLGGSGVLKINLAATKQLITQSGGLIPMLFFAFSISLLGVSGFESSSNFVEEQKPGVFRKTLRNMTLGVLIFPPIVSWVMLNVLTLPAIHQARDFPLAQLALGIGGPLLLILISIDAFFVLCGALLTSYIGVSGLAYRMALDNCLPQIFNKQNSRDAHPRIVFAFAILCTSILLLTHDNLLSLAGVYTLSFLGVMSLFAIANLVLRQTRPELKRPYQAPLLFVLIALFATTAGLLGTISMNPKTIGYFFIYLIPAVLLVLLVIFRRDVYRRLAWLFGWIGPSRRFFDRRYEQAIHTRFYVFLAHAPELFRALQYIHANESGHRVTIIHCQSKKEEMQHTKDIPRVIPMLNRAGVFPHFDIQYRYLKKPFSPELVDRYARTHHIPKNRIFIGTIHHHDGFDYADFGGARIIL